MALGIIGPSTEEISPLIDLLGNRQVARRAMLDFHSGDYCGTRVVAVRSGVGKVNAAIAAQCLVDSFGVSHILLSGVAGAMRPGLAVGDIVVANEVTYHDVDPGILTEYHPWMPEANFRPDADLLRVCLSSVARISPPGHWYVGRIVTDDPFVTSSERESIMARLQPLCVDMESAAVAHVCYVNQIPCLVLRSISDHADDGGAHSSEQNVARSSVLSMDVVREVIKALAHP